MSVKLHDYQQSASDKFFDAGKRGTLLYATGTGKTEIAIGVIERYIKEKPSANILFIAQQDIVHVDLEVDVSQPETVGIAQIGGQAFDVFAEVDSGQVVRQIELLVHQGHRPNPVLADLKRA